MNNRTQFVFVISVLIIVILVVLWVVGLGTPWALLAAVVAFVWKVIVVPIWDLILAAIGIVKDFLIMIAGVFIVIGVAIIGLFAAAALIVLGVGLIATLSTRLIGSQFRELNARLDRSDRMNVFLVFFMFMLPTLLAVLYLFAESKEFTIRSLVSLGIGVFCIARALIIFDSGSIKWISRVICAMCFIIIVGSGLVWLRQRAAWVDIPSFIFDAFRQPRWESRLAFYAFASLTLVLAVISPLLASRVSKPGQSVTQIGMHASASE